MRYFTLVILVGIIPFIAEAQEMVQCGACFGKGYVDIKPASSSIAYSTAECGNCRQTYRVSQGHSHACVYCKGTKYIATAKNWSDDPYFLQAQQYANKLYGVKNTTQQSFQSHNNGIGPSKVLDKKQNNTQNQIKKPLKPKPRFKKYKFLGKTITVQE